MGGSARATHPKRPDEPEWDVLDAMREGLKTRQIAESLFISETTVRRHVGSILNKLQVPDRDAAFARPSSVREI